MNREKLWDDIRQGFKDGVQYTVQKTEELTRIGRLKLDIHSQKKKIERRFTELGGLVYECLRVEDHENLEVDAAMHTVVLDLRELEQKLQELEQDLEATNSRPMEESGEDVDGEVVFISNMKEDKQDS